MHIVLRAPTMTVSATISYTPSNHTNLYDGSHMPASSPDEPAFSVFIRRRRSAALIAMYSVPGGSCAWAFRRAGGNVGGEGRGRTGADERTGWRACGGRALEGGGRGERTSAQVGRRMSGRADGRGDGAVVQTDDRAPGGRVWNR